MMRNVLPLTALILSLSGGAAFADHYRGDHRGPAVVREHGGERGEGFVRDHRTWEGRGRYEPRYEPRYQPRYDRVVRRPVFVNRPVIREHYYNYYRRPQVIVENYGAMPGYFWTAGQWSWDGYEWVWQAGHYEPDPSYVDAAYDPNCDHGAAAY
jgi:hypothetical protein